MRRIFSLLGIFITGFAVKTTAQQPLPHINVRNISGKIIVSWTNEYRRPAKVVTIQRSFDSLRNYTSIATVLSPENIDNGYADPKPPYNNMYYRVFVAFEGGSYAFSEVRRPGKKPVATELSVGDSIALYALKPFSG